MASPSAYAFKAERGGRSGPLRAATYTNISKTHFTWRGEKSEEAEGGDRFHGPWSAIATPE